MKKSFLALSFIVATTIVNAEESKPSTQNASAVAMTPTASPSQSSKLNASSAITKTAASATTVTKPIVSGVFATNLEQCKKSPSCSLVYTTSGQVLTAINGGASADAIQDIVTPQFDFVLMTKYALANNWKLATSEQKTQLVNLFKQLLVFTYSAAISKFKNAQITILTDTIDGKGETSAVVSQVILPNTGSAQPIKVEYDLAKPKSASSWKAYDIKIENTSLVTTYRTQFNDVIQTSKVDGLIKQLQTKIATLQSMKN